MIVATSAARPLVFSACLEWLFADEAPDFIDRMCLARRAGLSGIEFWKWSDKDIPAIILAARELDLAVTAILAEPMIAIVDPANHDAFIAGLRQSAAVAQSLGAPVLIAQAGYLRAGPTRLAQRTALIACLVRAADTLAGTGVRLGLEPLNTVVDHAGYFLPFTPEALDILDEVARPEIGLTYDIYHSAVMGERAEDVLGGRMHHVVHVHVADHPGRGAPGTGRLDLAHRLQWLVDNGYSGAVGLEFKVTGATMPLMPAALTALRG